MTIHVTFNRIRLAALVAAALSAVACGTGKADKGDPSDGKLKYEPKVNEVEVITIKKSTFTNQLVANGKLSARAKTAMNFKSAGMISECNVRNGQSVKAGSVIARLDSEDKRLALESARIALDKARLDYYDVLAGQGYMAEDTLSVPENIRKMAKMRSGYDAARNSLRRAEIECQGTVLLAPFDGKIADVKARAFEMSGSEPFCTLIDDSSFDVDFTVLESEYPFLEKGLTVKVSPFSSGGKVLQGKISEINPKVDKNGQVSVKASVRNDGSLIEGMNVKVVVERILDHMMVVPKSAVVIRDNLEVIFRLKDGKAAWTYVHVLMSNSESHAIIANEERGAELSEGDQVIVSGNLNLAEGSEVIVKE